MINEQYKYQRHNKLVKNSINKLERNLSTCYLKLSGSFDCMKMKTKYIQKWINDVSENELKLKMDDLK